MPLRRLCRCILAFVIAPLVSLSAQLSPPSTGGVAARALEERGLGRNARVLVIGAHPDDEDSELLTVLVRELGVETAYLSLTRGEGGQNLLGPELGPALGVLRTEELLAARELDGARQYFTRAYDFGFSKNLDDTWAHWPRDTVLEDVVRVVRRFQPQIVVSIFSGTARDGHGQHQAAGWAALAAFGVAGDSTRFPELAREGLRPWRPLKLYRSTRFDSAATTLRLDGGAIDSVLGQTYHQIAMRSRSQHRSQDMGQLQRIGPSEVRLALIEDRTGRGADGLLAGLDPSAAVTGAAAERRRERVAAIARGVLCDAVSDDDRVVAGQTIAVALTCWAPGLDAPVAAELALESAAWPAVARRDPMTVAPGVLFRRELTVRVPDSAAPAQPYYLRRGGADGLYRWPDRPSEILGAPFEPPLLVASFGTLAPPREVSFRRNDQALGEIRRPLVVVPRVAVSLDPQTEIWPLGDSRPHRFTVTLGHGARDTTRGRVRLVVPAGWPAPPAQPFTLDGEDAREVLAFELRAPARLAAGSFEVRAVAEADGGGRYHTGVVTVSYPHIRPRSYSAPAAAAVRATRLALPAFRRLGYVRGAGDRVPEALAALRLPVEPIGADALERGDLSRYDAIVVGPRAYETEPALAANNGRLLAYARAGGHVLVQYQQYEYFARGYAPYPLALASRPIGSTAAPTATSRPDTARARVSRALLGGHDRVTDETAPVRIVAPDHPAVRGPNRLGPADWEGWVQERGLYFAREWDPAWRPIVETHDPGEPPLEGGLLVARVGRGTYVYTGLSFFRQLPAGVPGAFRLFANLLALE